MKKIKIRRSWGIVLPPTSDTKTKKHLQTIATVRKNFVAEIATKCDKI